MVAADAEPPSEGALPNLGPVLPERRELAKLACCVVGLAAFDLLEADLDALERAS